MRGKHYDADKRKVFTTGGYVGVILAVLIIAAIVAMTLLVLLPSTEEETPSKPQIVGIKYDDKRGGEDLGAGADPESVYFTITYSDGTTKDVPLSSMRHEGLDIKTEGDQKITVSYGGLEQSIKVNVKDVSCVLSYTASVGGRIQGTAKQSIISGEDADTVIAIPETGYEFEEWSDGYPYATRKDLAVNESKEFMAIFKKSKFRVVFFLYDGTVASEEDVVYGEKATKIPNLSDPRMNVYGHRFDGWSVSEEDYSNVIRDMNIYPQYTKKATDVTVNVSSDQYGNVMGKTDANECGYYAYELAAITATPHNSRVFDHWEIKNSDGVYERVEAYGEGSEKLILIGDNRVGVTFTSGNSGDGALSYKLSFECSEEIAEVIINVSFAYETSSVTFINYQNSLASNREFYIDNIAHGETLGTYFSDENVISGYNVEIDKNNTRYVVDETGNYVLDINGNRKTEINPNYGLITPVGKYYGLEFVGWYLKGDDAQKSVTAEQKFLEPSTLIAKWRKKIYNVQFIDGEKIYGTVSVIYQDTIGSGGGVPDEIPSKDGYLFVAWVDMLTKESVDDRTQISYKAEYGEDSNKDFIDKDTIKIVPNWRPKEHTLTVNVIGNGTVELTKKLGAQVMETIPVAGEYVISEEYLYTVSFKANEDHIVEQYSWSYGGIQGDTVYAEEIEFSLKEKFDNAITVTFVPKTYYLNIINGNSAYNGNIAVGGIVYDASVIEKEINSGDTVSFEIKSANTAFAVKTVKVTGYVNGEYQFEKELKNIGGEGSDYLVNVGKCTSDVTVAVEYYAIKYYLTVVQPDVSDGAIYKTGFNAGSYTDSKGQSEFSRDEYAYYYVESNEGKYISALRINGIKYDLYSRSSSDVIFYDRVVNGYVDEYGNKPISEVSFKLIDNQYYYCYGYATVGENEYMYAENADTEEVVIFYVKDKLNEIYEKTEFARNASPDTGSFEGMKSYLADALEVERKKQTDYRVTAIKIMVKMTQNINISVNFSDISYTVSVDESKYGTYSISKTSVGINGNSDIKCTPITGYNIIGYKINGGDTVPVVTVNENAPYGFTVRGIKEDKNITVIYQEISYDIVFNNKSALSSNVYVKEKGSDEEFKLSSSYSFTKEYSSTGEFILRVEDGKRIVSVKIKVGAGSAVEMPIANNLQVYEYNNYNIESGVSIDIECADIEEDSSAFTVYNSNDSGNIFFGSSTSANGKEVYVVAENGFYLSSIRLSGEYHGTTRVIVINNITESGYQLNDEYSDTTIEEVTSADSYRNGLKIVLKADAFDSDAILLAKTEPKKFNIYVDDVQNGLVTIEGSINNQIEYGNEISVILEASDKYYISSFKINGKEISFGSKNWDGLIYDGTVGQFIHGNYKFIASKDVTVSVEYKKYSYKVKLDPASVCGTTVLSVGGKEVSEIEDGEVLNISMESDEGYHITELLINGNDVGFKLYGDVLNNNTQSSFTYNGATGDGVHGDVSVLVRYEINRYTFNLEVLNDSVNFNGNGGAGDVFVDGVKASNHLGIAHGDDFYLDIYPSLSSGYYLYEISIAYKGYNDSKTEIRTLRCDEENSLIGKTGGVVWFNRFMNGDSKDERYNGVTADIELITVKFRREKYLLTISQLSEKISGTVKLNVTNPNNAVDDIALFTEDTNDYTAYDLYYFRPTNGKIYVLREGHTGKEETSLTLSYVIDQTVTEGEKGHWRFGVFDDGKFRNFYFEHGLFYRVTLTPTTGYEMAAFSVNGEDKKSSVLSRGYSSGINKQIDLAVVYEILTFEISIDVSVFNSSMNSVSYNDIGKWVGIKIIVDGETIKEIDADNKALAGGNITLKLDYGVNFKIVFIPNYNEHGVYLDTLSVNGSQMGIAGDKTAEVAFERIIKEKMTIRPAFYVMKYAVDMNIGYQEAGIYNETVNIISAADNAAVQDRMEISWGESATIRIIAGTGYYVDSIVITYIENGIEKTEVISNYPDLSEIYKKGERYRADGRVVDWLYLIKNQYDIVKDETRDLFTIGGIKCAYSVTVNFKRNEYFLFYSIADEEVPFVSDIHSYYNTETTQYPSKLVKMTESTTPFMLNVKHYDELCVYIYPKDGYEIGNAVITLERGTYTPTDGFVPFENSDVINPTFSLSAVEEGSMARLFNFKETSKYIDSHARIVIKFNIRRYQLETSITRDNSSNKSATANTTAINLGVRDYDNNKIIISATERQEDILFEKDSAPLSEAIIAEHHGTINYTFDTPSGYMLNLFTVNGFTKEELIELGLLRARESRISVKEKDSDIVKYTYYRYEYTVLVTTTLIGGASSNTNNTKININIVTGPIEYDINFVLDERLYSFGLYQGKNGVSDNSKITVYSPSKVRHYDTIVVEPQLFEGYEIGTNDASKVAAAYVYFGTETLNLGDYSSDKVIAAFSGEANGITGRRTCVFSSDITVNANVAEYYYDSSTGKHIYTPRQSDIYFVFYTRIKRYRQDINTYAYYEVNGEYDGKPKAFNPNAQDGASDNVGTINITVLDKENNIVYNTNTGVLGDNYEYFSKITVVAKPRAGYALYGVYEYFGKDKNGEDVWLSVRNGTNGISYTTVNGEHTFSYTIDKLGARKFKFDFKQKATITLRINNPYKYDYSSGRYVAYTEIKAYSDVNKFDLDTFEANKDAYIINRKSIVSDEVVIEEYEFEVFIGNMLKFVYEDKYAVGGYAEIEYYTCNLSDIAEGLIGSETRDNYGNFVTNAFTNKYINKIRNARCDDLKKEGYEIKSSVTLYAYTSASSHVYTQKTTIGAQTKTVSGNVYYNGAQGETVNNELYIYPPEEPTLDFETTITAGQLLKIELFAEPNYIFHKLNVKQINFEESRKAGRVIFETSELKQLSLTRLQYSDDDVISAFNTNNRNYFSLIDYSMVEETASYGNGTVNHYILYFWVCGDITLEAEFYRTYNVSYGMFRTDYVTKYGEKDGVTSDGITINKNSVVDIVFGSDVVSDSGTTAVVSYGATFNIETIMPSRNAMYPYQFVGWYINGANLFTYLEQVIPEERDMRSTVQVNIDSMPSLMKNGKEVENITIYAVFQPVIDVTVINEKYYSFADHFNSWSMVDVLVNAYEFNPKTPEQEVGEPPQAMPTKTNISDLDGRNLNAGADYIKESKSYSNFAEKSRALDNWSDYMKDYNSGIIKGYSASDKERYILYTAYYDFTMLLENITDNDYLNDSWATSVIELSTSGKPSDVQFSSWQYYNWGTGLWTDIPYKYEDKNYGVSADGKYTVVDCYFENYNFSLAGLYNSGMDYAISYTDKTNIDANRPLLIRADMYKQVSVRLRQYSFDNDLQGEISEFELSTNIVMPQIVSNVPSDSRFPKRSEQQTLSGKFEYGTDITISYNQSKTTAQVIMDNQLVRYRFLGWFMMYGESAEEEYQSAYYLYNSEYDTSGSENYTVTLTCMTNESRMTFNFRAYYVTQYRQTIYSYNISGGEEQDYQSAMSYGYSVNDAPNVKFIGTTKTGKDFRYVNKLSYSGSNKLDYDCFTDAGAVSKQFYYWVNSIVGECPRQNVNGADYVNNSKTHDYFIDAGLKYTLEVDTDGSDEGLTDNQIRNGARGFYPGVDTLYECFYYTENESDKVYVKDANYISYYNTGKGTYYEKSTNKCLLPSEMTNKATKDISTIYNNELTVNGKATASGTKEYRTYLIKYVSTATLLFYNVVYKGGVSVPSSLAKILTADKLTSLTVWDEDPTYGDWYTIQNGKAVNAGANGEIVIRVTLINVIDEGYYGKYSYAFGGMKNGEGIYSNKDLANDDASSSSALFSSMHGNYTRWREVNMERYMGSKKMFLFGQSGYSNSAALNTNNKTSNVNTTKVKYTTDNCGDALAGYKIYDNDQLRNIEYFWENNDYSCKGIYDPCNFVLFNEKGKPLKTPDYMATKFSLYSNIALEKCTVAGASGMPYSNVIPWEPLCKKDVQGRANIGFDGILSNAANYYIHSLAVHSNIITGNTGYNFGIFAKANGGRFENLYIDNAFVLLNNIQYLGILVGKAWNTEFANITFSKYTSYAMFNQHSYSPSPSLTAGTRVYLACSSSKGTGMLAGYAENCNISQITINSDNYIIEVGGQNCGALVGEIKGGTVNGVTYNGAKSWLLSGVDGISSVKSVGGIIGILGGGCVAENIKVTNSYMIIGAETTAVVSGGIVGTMKDKATVLKGVTFNMLNDTSNPYKINVIVSNKLVGYKGVYVLAKTSSVSSARLTDDTYGKAGGVIGYIENGTFDNYYNSTYYNITGVLKAVAGTTGYVVGVNKGTVTGIELETGESTGTRSFMLSQLAHEGASMSYNIGGVVGANLTGGIVNDCSVLGTYTPSAGNETNWKQGHVYVFARKSVAANGINSWMNDYSYEAIDLSAQPTGQTGFTFRFNVTYGGIVGYNKGSVFNSFVIKTKITFKAYTNMTQNETKSSIISTGGGYSWGIEAGLIVGYSDPDNAYDNGWIDAIAMAIKGNDWQSIIDLDLISGRIQSCYSLNSEIDIVGATSCDMPSRSDEYGNESLKVAIGIGGICGGTGVNAEYEYAINACKASGNRYVYKADATGSDSKDGYYYHTWTEGDWIFKQEFSEVWEKDAFYQVEISMDNIVAGVNPTVTKNYATMYYGGAGYTYLLTSNSTQNKETIRWFGMTDNWWFDAGTSNPAMQKERYTRYFMSDKSNIYSSLPIEGYSSTELDVRANTTNSFYPYEKLKYGQTQEVTASNVNGAGFLDGRVVKTDYKTGLLLYGEHTGANGTVKLCNTPNEKYKNGGDDVSPVTSNYDELYGKYWNVYNMPLFGYTPITNTSVVSPNEYCVRMR